MLPTRRPRRGFTLSEMLVVTGLTVLLVTILSTVWSSFCGPAIDVMFRCRIAQEADFALASFSKDFGGSLPDAVGRTGSANDWKWLGRQTPDGASLRLCYHSPDSSDMLPQWAAPDVVVSYYLDNGQLWRSDETAGTSTVVAELVTDFQVEPLVTNDGVVITLTFAARNLPSITYSIVALDPPSA